MRSNRRSLQSQDVTLLTLLILVISLSLSAAIRRGPYAGNKYQERASIIHAFHVSRITMKLTSDVCHPIILTWIMISSMVSAYAGICSSAFEKEPIDSSSTSTRWSTRGFDDEMSITQCEEYFEVG